MWQMHNYVQLRHPLLKINIKGQDCCTALAKGGTPHPLKKYWAYVLALPG